MFRRAVNLKEHIVLVAVSNSYDPYNLDLTVNRFRKLLWSFLTESILIV